MTEDAKPMQAQAVAVPAPHTQAFGSFRNPTNLTKWLKIFLYTSIAIDALAFFSGILQYQLLSDFKRSVYSSTAMATAAAEANDKRQQFIALSQVAIYIMTAILFLRWIYQANYNARQLGARGLRFTPGWAIGWYFVPLAFLWKPYQAMKEIWQASKNPSAWEAERRGGILPWWWFFFIVNALLQHAAFRNSLRDERINELLVSTAMIIVANLVSIPATIVAVGLVTQIYNMQMSHVQHK